MFYSIIDNLNLGCNSSFFLYLLKFKWLIFNFSFLFRENLIGYLILMAPVFYILFLLFFIVINIFIFVFKYFKNNNFLIWLSELLPIVIFFFISFFIDKLPLTKFYFSHKHFKFMVKFYFEDFDLYINKFISERIVGYIWHIFLRSIHTRSIIFYLRFFFFYLLNLFIFNIIFFYFYFFWCLKRFFFFFFASYLYYYYFYYSLFLYYLHIYVNFFSISYLIKRIWLNYFAFFYIKYLLGFILYILSYHNLNFNLNYKFNINLENKEFFFNYFYVVVFYFHFYILSFLKYLIISCIVNKFLLYLVKYYIYLIFIFFDILFLFDFKEIIRYFFYLNFFYFHLFIKFLIKYLYLLKFLFYYFIFIFCYNIIILFWNFFIFIFSFIFRWIFFNKYMWRLFLVIILYNLYLADVFVINYISLQFLDFTVYVFNFIILILDTFYFFYFFSIDIFEYISYSKLTPIHIYLKYPDSYTVFIDFFYYLRILFIDYFPYKCYIWVSYIFYFKNIIYFLLYFNQIFLFMWYLFFYLFLKDISIINIVSIWLFYLFKYCGLLIKMGIFFFLNLIDINWLWFFYISKFNISFFYFFIFLDTSFICWFFMDFFNLFMHFSSIFKFNFLFLNYLISYIYMGLDFFSYSSFQYQFNDYPEDLNTLIGYKRHYKQAFYWKYKIKHIRTYWSNYLYYLKYRSKFGNNFFIVKDNDVLFTKPLTKRHHWRWRLRVFTPRQWYYVRILIPKLGKKYKYNFWIQYTVRWIWGFRFYRLKKHTPWTSFYYGVSNKFFLDTLTPIAYTLGYYYEPLDNFPTYGYTDLDRFFYIYSIFLILVLICLFYIFSNSFRDMYFPRFWYPTNADYIWRVFQKDISKHGLWLYVDREKDKPLGITDTELSTGNYYYYSKLVKLAGLPSNDFFSFINNEDFSSFYNIRYSGDLNKLAAFDYFCNISLEFNPYFGPMFVREDFHHFDELMTEEKEYSHFPKSLDFDGRFMLFRKLNNYFFSIDSFFNFSLPFCLFHNEIYNISYYKTPDDSSYIPFDFPSLFEHINCWFIIFPSLLCYYVCFEIVYSMDGLYWTDILQKILPSFSFSFFYIFIDFAFYIFYFDLLVDDCNSIESAWTWVYGAFDDRFFFTKFPVFFDWYECIYLSDYSFIDFVNSFFVSPSFRLASWVIVLFNYIIFIIVFGFIWYICNKSYYFSFFNKNINYVNKFIFYFNNKLKKY